LGQTPFGRVTSIYTPPVSAAPKYGAFSSDPRSGGHRHIGVWASMIGQF
jgi:hypothetical protein